jgi:hypothetical protein
LDRLHRNAIRSGYDIPHSPRPTMDAGCGPRAGACYMSCPKRCVLHPVYHRKGWLASDCVTTRIIQNCGECSPSRRLGRQLGDSAQTQRLWAVDRLLRQACGRVPPYGRTASRWIRKKGGMSISHKTCFVPNRVTIWRLDDPFRLNWRLGRKGRFLNGKWAFRALNSSAITRRLSNLCLVSL